MGKEKKKRAVIVRVDIPQNAVVDGAQSLCFFSLCSFSPTFPLSTTLPPAAKREEHTISAKPGRLGCFVETATPVVLLGGCVKGSLLCREAVWVPASLARDRSIGAGQVAHIVFHVGADGGVWGIATLPTKRSADHWGDREEGKSAASSLDLCATAHRAQGGRRASDSALAMPCCSGRGR